MSLRWQLTPALAGRLVALHAAARGADAVVVAARESALRAETRYQEAVAAARLALGVPAGVAVDLDLADPADARMTTMDDGG